jgi:hypothetical protein
VKYLRCSLAGSFVEATMEVHQTEFLFAVALASVVALAMTVWDTSGQETQYTGVKKSDIAVAVRKVEVQP